MLISEMTAFWLVIIGAVVMISGAFITKHALRQMSRSNEELSRGLWRMTNKRDVPHHIGCAGVLHDCPRRRPDECKPDAPFAKAVSPPSGETKKGGENEVASPDER